MRVYVDSSALIKRVVEEPESRALEEALRNHVDGADALVSSSLAWIEVSRALRTRLDGPDPEVANDAVADAFAGVAERPMSAEVVSLARRVGPRVLRSLDAIHLASAVLLDADLLLTYDSRLADAGRDLNLQVAAPAD